MEKAHTQYCHGDEVSQFSIFLLFVHSQCGMRQQSRTPLCGPVSNNSFKLSHTLCSTTLLLLSFHSHLLYSPFLYSLYLLTYFFLSPLHSPSLSSYSSPMTFSHSPLMHLVFSADVHQGETDHPCDEGWPHWHQEQGDRGGRRYGGHGLRHQHPAQGETKKREMLEVKRKRSNVWLFVYQWRRDERSREEQSNSNSTCKYVDDTKEHF